MYARTLRRTGYQVRNFPWMCAIFRLFPIASRCGFSGFVIVMTLRKMDTGNNSRIVRQGSQLSVSEIGDRIGNSAIVWQEIGGILVEFGRLGGLPLRHTIRLSATAPMLPAWKGHASIDAVSRLHSGGHGCIAALNDGPLEAGPPGGMIAG